MTKPFRSSRGEPFWQRLLFPLQAPYALALGLKNTAYAQGWLKARELSWPVVSVGNLSVGGAGKTPIVIALAELLLAHGFSVDVLSRGYGRRSPESVEPVSQDGDAARFGDEPVLVTRATGVPVYVGASRYAAGRLAEQREATLPCVHLLDDGFQHRALARAVDIVVVHPSDLRARLLPAGRLRERFAALRRADFLILRAEDTSTALALEQEGIRKPVWRVRRTLVKPALAGAAVAFCGIAHPEEFFMGLRAHNLALCRTIAFRDHHRYRSTDIDTIAGHAAGAAAVLTTEKDWVRLNKQARARLSAVAPLLAVSLTAELLNARKCATELIAHVERHTARQPGGLIMRK